MGYYKSVSLIPVLVSFLFLITFTGPALAGAAEDLSDTIYDKAMRERNGIGVSNVRVKDGVVTYDANQSVIQGGSKYKIEQKDIKLPASNDSIYKNAAKYAKGIFKANLAIYASSAAMEQLLNGVGYVMGEGGQVVKPPTIDGVAPSNLEYCYRFGSSGSHCYGTALSSVSDYLMNNSATYKNYRDIKYEGFESGNQYRYSWAYDGTYGETRASGTSSYIKNPNYDPLAPPPENVKVPDAELEDAFTNWFKNNPSSVTDPVLTYIYSPKDPKTGKVAQNTTSEHPSFGGVEINDEMMNNYIDNYHDRLAREAKKEETIQKPQSETKTDPSGETTTTTVNPDGSTTTTRTKTEANPDTGEVTTTKTETTVKPDGTTETKTETTTSTKPNPEVTELPLVCDYFAFLCEWTDWTKKTWQEFTENRDEDTEIEIEIPEVSEDYNLSVSGSCPSSFVLIDTTVMGMPYKIEFEWGDFCNILSNYVRPILIALASFYAILIVAGVRNNA